MAFSKGLGAVHSMSHAIGADQELRLHHGTLNGAILPTILRFNEIMLVISTKKLVPWEKISLMIS